MAPSIDLLEELKTLRKGRGVYTPRIEAQVGPGLRAACGVTIGDEKATIRQKVIERLSEFASTLPGDLGLAATAALAVHPQARQAFLNQRIQWLAERLGRDERTARRRMDDGIAQLAEVMGRHATGSARPQAGPNEGWYVAEFSAALMLDRPAPVAIERRRIVAESDGIDQISFAISLPRDPTDRSVSRDLLGEVIYGGTLVAKEHASDSQFRFVLKLPLPLRVGDQHEYAMIFQVPPNQPMRTHYVHISPRRCDLFDLRIRFDAERLPEQLWRVSGLFHRALDDGQPSGEMLIPDDAGELHLQFHDLMPGFGYGVQWKNPATYELQHDAGIHPIPVPPG